ncbi:MAG: hypothetical protein ABSB23_20495 [Bryobacteraceae bacterium]
MPKYVAIGILEGLWHFAAKFAPQGDIGRFSDAAIARAIEWDHEPRVLVNTLVKCGWIDRHSTSRLVIHDWSDHADQTLKRYLASRKLAFIQHDASSIQHDASIVLALPDESADPPLPVPLPVPIPVPEPNTCASQSNAQEGLLSLDNPPFDTLDEVKPDRESWFSAWWGIYWLHKARKPAHDAFMRRVKTDAIYRQVMDATRAQAPEMLAREPSKRPHGATWLNGERWNDELSAPGATKPESRADILARALAETELEGESHA